MNNIEKCLAFWSQSGGRRWPTKPPFYACKDDSSVFSLADYDICSFCFRAVSLFILFIGSLFWHKCFVYLHFSPVSKISCVNLLGAKNNNFVMEVFGSRLEIKFMNILIAFYVAHLFCSIFLLVVMVISFFS